MRRAAIFVSAISHFSGGGFWYAEIVSCVIALSPRSRITSKYVFSFCLPVSVATTR